LYTEVKRKKLILENRKPYSKEAQELIREQEQLDLIFGGLLLDGISLNKEDILKIARGEYVVTLSINDHVIIRNYCDAYALLNEMLQFQYELDEKGLIKLYKVFTKSTQESYRSANPILHTIDYNPPHFKAIDEQMKVLFDFIRESKLTMNPIMRAAYFHNKLIEIYPFESSNFEIARLALEYELMLNGLPIIMLDFKEQDYFEHIRRYLKTENVEYFYNSLLGMIIKKQEFLLSITKITQ
jgi:Fic family protein